MNMLAILGLAEIIMIMLVSSIAVNFIVDCIWK
jgi:hypothetical protein